MTRKKALKKFTRRKDFSISHFLYSLNTKKSTYKAIGIAVLALILIPILLLIAGLVCLVFVYSNSLEMDAFALNTISFILGLYGLRYLFINNSKKLNKNSNEFILSYPVTEREMFNNMFYNSLKNDIFFISIVSLFYGLASLIFGNTTFIHTILFLIINITTFLLVFSVVMIISFKIEKLYAFNKKFAKIIDKIKETIQTILITLSFISYLFFQFVVYLIDFESISFLLIHNNLFFDLYVNGSYLIFIVFVFVSVSLFIFTKLYYQDKYFYYLYLDPSITEKETYQIGTQEKSKNVIYDISKKILKREKLYTYANVQYKTQKIFTTLVFIAFAVSIGFNNQIFDAISFENQRTNFILTGTVAFFAVSMIQIILSRHMYSLHCYSASSYLLQTAPIKPEYLIDTELQRTNIKSIILLIIFNITTLVVSIALDAFSIINVLQLILFSIVGYFITKFNVILTLNLNSRYSTFMDVNETKVGFTTSFVAVLISMAVGLIALVMNGIFLYLAYLFIPLYLIALPIYIYATKWLKKYFVKNYHNYVLNYDDVY